MVEQEIKSEHGTSNKESDETYTPYYAVEPLLKYIPKDKVIWCPCDEEWSAYYQTFKENGYKVIRSSLVEGQDFFEYEPDEHYDIIVTNPPFSLSVEFLKRIKELNKPYAILMPLKYLQGDKRFEFMVESEILFFAERVDYHTNNNFITYTAGNHFASAYFCKDVLPELKIGERLNKYDRQLKDSSTILYKDDKTLKSIMNRIEKMDVDMDKIVFIKNKRPK